MNDSEKSFYNQADVKDCEDFLKWYIDLVETYPDTFIYYLTDSVQLLWFGRTVKGPEKILGFLKTTLQGTKHIFTNAFPTSTFDIRNSRGSTMANDVELGTKQLKSLHLTKCGDPTNNNSVASTSSYDPLAGGDGLHINKFTSECYSVVNHMNRLPMHSTKSVKHMQSIGAIEFTKMYYKPGIPLTKWKRPCVLKIEYSGTLNSATQYTINVISYENNMSCKRNLLPEFDKCAEETE